MTALRLALLPLGLTVLLSACATTNECVVNNPHKGEPLSLNPSIEEIDASNATHGAVVGIAADVRVPGASGKISHGARVRVRSTREPDLAFGPALAMEKTSYNRYERSLYQLNFGPYEACVEADFLPQPGLNQPEPTVSTLRDHQAFFVKAAEPCATWADASEGTAGWTFSGIVDVASGAPATGSSQPYFARMELDVPVDVPGLVVLTGDLYADQPDALWRFDYVSPDLSGLEAWQDLPEVAIQAYTNGANIQLQPIFGYTYEGELHQFAPVDENGDWIFYPVSGTTRIYPPSMRPGDVPLSELRVRVFGPYGSTTPEFMVHLEVVCPMPSRFPSVLRAVLGELQAGK